MGTQDIFKVAMGQIFSNFPEWIKIADAWRQEKQITAVVGFSILVVLFVQVFFLSYTKKKKCKSNIV